MFPPTSRYYRTKTAEFEEANGRRVVYLRRRFTPAPERFALLFEHTVTEGERLDNVTFKYLGDAEQFWRIADANGAVRPEELTETPGRRLRITLPEGVPATPNA
jgi:hypothetical protein